MDFNFSREQLMFKKEVVRFAKKEIVPRVQEHDLKSEFDFQSFLPTLSYWRRVPCPGNECSYMLISRMIQGRRHPGFSRETAVCALNAASTSDSS